MPVLPDVGSMITVSGVIWPSRSPASIMARPILSFTDDSGLKNSHLPTRSARQPASAATRPSRMSGVAPTVSTTLS